MLEGCGADEEIPLPKVGLPKRTTSFEKSSDDCESEGSLSQIHPSQQSARLNAPVLELLQSEAKFRALAEI